ncbi:acyl-CoA dehydrogenase family protein [Nocardia sp. NPDC046763]|uniref:acyl-CoA dehydrogenase family protein n=1 Tax=Nocardia sp. NPDC046763 TaxID=3155256 RepID=UPI0034069489
MDFGFDDTQSAVREAMDGILSRGPGSGEVWPMLHDSGLLALAIPEEYGGAGLGAVEVGIVSRALGGAALTSPFLGTAIAGLVASRAVVEPQVSDWCKGVMDGDVTAVCVRAAGERELPRLDGKNHLISGVFGPAQHSGEARWLLVPTTGGPVLVDLAQPGITAATVETALATAEPTAPPDAQFTLDAVKVTPLLSGTDAVGVFTDLYRTVFLSYASGLLHGALRLTADHLGSREQFGRPLATFQAASQEIADVYVLATALESISLYCDWTLDSGGRPSADLDAGLFLFAGEGRAAMQMCHHLHGGLGVDTTFPMHRYFSSTKDVVRHCGGERHNLTRLATHCS